MPKQRRRMLRGGVVDEGLGYEKIGLKKLGDRARGLLTERDEDAGSEDSLGVGRKLKRKKRARISESRHLEGKLHLEDLVKQADEIAQDKENLQVRTVRATLITRSELTVSSPLYMPRSTRYPPRSTSSRRSEDD